MTWLPDPHRLHARPCMDPMLCELQAPHSRQKGFGADAFLEPLCQPGPEMPPSEVPSAPSNPQPPSWEAPLLLPGSTGLESFLPDSSGIPISSPLSQPLGGAPPPRRGSLPKAGSTVRVKPEAFNQQLPDYFPDLIHVLLQIIQITVDQLHVAPGREEYLVN